MKKTILITGATDGIGKLLALRLASEGHILFLHGRNADKLTSLNNEIRSQGSKSTVHTYKADFSNLTEVLELAQKISRQHKYIDILINNAGVYNSPISKNADGFDMRFAVNYFAPYIFTEKLIPLLKRSQNPRIINLSSAAQSTVDVETLRGDTNISESQAYAQSKLALTSYSFELSKMHSAITIIAVNPGSLLDTTMAKTAFGQSWSPADKGSNILYDLALSPEYSDASGKYFDNDLGREKGDFGTAHGDCYDKEKRKNLIKETQKLLEKFL